MTKRSLMTRSANACLGPFVLAAAVGCASMGPTVQVYGSPGDLERLSGEWSGDYVAKGDYRRQGSISFRLSAAGSHAYGDVLMTADGSNQPYGRYYGEDSFRRGQEQTPRDSLLTIRFVRVDGDTVSGILDNYWDPDRRTMASSVFQGVLKDDVIEGTFRTQYASRESESGGRWKVTRHRRQP